jgi:uncharacterized protein YlaI
MAKRPKIVGYGICGPNEPYLEATLKEFERLCDEVIICFNNATEKEKALVNSFGFKMVENNTEWGKFQWKIKQDFLTNHVAKLNPDMCVCLDMDEVFDKHLTKEGLYALYDSQFQAFYFFIINLWDDGYQKERSFWNIRAWKWNGDTKFPQKNLHCGLAPEWTWVRAFYSPYILKHYGLKDKERREAKAQRYDKYDPNARFIAKEYYDSLRSSPQVTPFDEDVLHQEVVNYVRDIKQKYINIPMVKEEVAYIQTLSGETSAVPKAKLADYLKQGCKHLVDYETLSEKIDTILNDEPVAEILTEETFTEAVENLKEQPKEEFMCGECGKKMPSMVSLRAHKLGAHRKWGK